MPIILDAMGSDACPDPEVRAAVDAVREFGEEVILVGMEDQLRPRLEALSPGEKRVRIVHAPEALVMSDHIEDARRKRQNSMRIGMDLLKQGQGEAFVTAGNTGMAMYTAKKALDDIPGVIRPALTALFPVRNGRCVVLDIGANAECRPEFLLQFAVMGSVYAEKMLGVSNPRIGLLSNGEEEGKGNDLVRATYPLLNSSGLNFIGNVEGKELYGGQADVVITDGFTGNVLLKTSEAVAKLMTDLLRQEMTSSLRTKIGALLAKPAFNQLKKLMDPGEVGAAPLLGIDGLVFVGHGRSDARALTSAIRVARLAVKADLLQALRHAIEARISERTAVGTLQ
jgi:glycerol-3-phosphate acyltransferase PlsX